MKALEGKVDTLERANAALQVTQHRMSGALWVVGLVMPLLVSIGLGGVFHLLGW